MRFRSLVAASAAFVVLLPACGQPGDVIVPHLSMNLTDSSTGFGITLLEHLLAEPDAGNVFISPLSATLALSMAASAAHGQTRAAILQVLGLDPTLDPSSEARQVIERLAQSDANAQLELANAVWAQKGLTLNPAYVARLRADYKAQLASLDFHSPDAPAVVNRWVDAATHHTISRLVDSFDPATVAYLVNATYFHALWSTEFKPDAKADFHTFSGATQSVSMMKRDESVTEVHTDDYVAELLPYKGGRFSAVILLPRQALSPATFATFLTSGVWEQALGSLHGATGTSLGGPCKPSESSPVICDGTLVMPKFKLDYEKDLTKTLAAMGMPIPGAGLPEICADCFISTVVQKTHLEVDEKGTTASAATGVAVATALRLPTVVDHPFALALIDNATDAPLFLGVIGQLS
jgi:serpin B